LVRYSVLTLGERDAEASVTVEPDATEVAGQNDTGPVFAYTGTKIVWWVVLYGE